MATFMTDAYIATGQDTQKLAIESSEGFSRVADAASAKLAISDAAAATAAAAGNVDLGLDKFTSMVPPDIANFGDKAYSTMTTKLADGRALIKGTMKAPADLMEKAKTSMFGAATSLKASFNALPKSVQAAIVGDTGILNTTGNFRLPGFGVSNNFGSFFNKITAGDYVLNPKSFKMDIKNLSSFTKTALKNGIFDSALNLSLSLTGKPGTVTNILAKVALGSLVAKNKKGLLKMGLSMAGAGPTTMPMAAGKSLLVRTAFKDLKLPKIKSSELIKVHQEIKGTASVFDRRALTNAGKVSAAAFTSTKAGADNTMTQVMKSVSTSGPAPDVSSSALNTVTPLDDDKLRAVAILSTPAVTEPDSYTGNAWA